MDVHLGEDFKGVLFRTLDPPGYEDLEALNNATSMDQICKIFCRQEGTIPAAGTSGPSSSVGAAGDGGDHGEVDEGDPAERYGGDKGAGDGGDHGVGDGESEEEVDGDGEGDGGSRFRGGRLNVLWHLILPTSPKLVLRI